MLRDAAARRASVAFRYRGTAAHGRPVRPAAAQRLLVRRRARPRARRAAHVPRRSHRGRRRPSARPVRSSGRRGSTCAAAFPADAKLLRGRRRRRDAVARVWVDAARAASVERELGSERVVAPAPRRCHRGRGAVRQPGAFGSWVLGLVDHAEVLSPPERPRPIVVRLAAPRMAGAGSGTTSCGRRRAERRRGSAAPPARDAAVADGARRGAAGRGGRPLRHDAGRGGARAGAGVDVRASPVRRRDDRRVHRRRDRVRRCAPAVHQAAAAHRPEGFALLTAGRAAMQLPGADPDSPLGRGLAKLAAALGDPTVGRWSWSCRARPGWTRLRVTEAVRRVERLRMRYWTASRDEVTERDDHASAGVPASTATGTSSPTTSAPANPARSASIASSRSPAPAASTTPSMTTTLRQGRPRQRRRWPASAPAGSPTAVCRR